LGDDRFDFGGGGEGEFEDRHDFGEIVGDAELGRMDEDVFGLGFERSGEIPQLARYGDVFQEALVIPEDKDSGGLGGGFVDEFEGLEGVAFAESSVVGVALVAIDKVPGVDRAGLSGGLDGLGDRRFEAFFFASGNVDDGIPGAQQQIKFGGERHRLNRVNGFDAADRAD
jgi:hypothetical protein